MDELITRLARTIACMTRLRILARLVRRSETAPTELSRELGIPVDLLSTHLRRLTSAGLIQRRRSGKWSYCVPRSPYSREAISGGLMAWLREILRSPRQALKNCTPEQVCNSSLSAEEELLEAVFDAATAFTNVRRLQILRFLEDQRRAETEALTRELRMSESAVSRHMAKLRRRGYVVAERTAGTLAYSLARESKTPIHSRLFGIIRKEWQKKKLHT